MRKQVLLAIFAMSLLSGLPAIAQTQSSENTDMGRKATKLSQENFRLLVRSSVKESCLRTAPISDSREKEESCDCYAKAYEERYSVKGLVKITNWLETNQDNSRS